MELWQLKQMQSLPLEAKIIKSQQRIREWYEHWDGDVYVSFSGGKDSTVLLHLVRDLYPDVPAVFCDTGLEFPEIRKFVKSINNVTWLRPAMNFREVINGYGYPVISKSQARYIREARSTKSEVLKKLRLTGVRTSGKPTRFAISKKWLYLVSAPFQVGERCCDVMKKRPFAKYYKQTGRVPLVGTMASEGVHRELEYLQTGCNSFGANIPKSIPLSFWLEKDIWDYLHRFDLPYSTIYDMGYRRTGCIFCMFGCHLEPYPNRFQRLSQTHPGLYDYCMRPWSEGGLDLAMVLDYVGVDYKFRGEQLTLDLRGD